MSLGISFSAGNRISASNLQAIVNLLDSMTGFPLSADGVNGTTTSTTYVNTLTSAPTPLTLVFTAFKAQHRITVTAQSLNPGASGPWNQYTSFRITGSGFTTYGPGDQDAGISQWSNNNIGSETGRSTMVSGLTPGVAYTVTMYHRVNNSTGSFTNRRIIVE